MYYNKYFNMSFCLDTFKSHVHNDQWSYYTLQIIMNIYDVLGNYLEKIDELKTAIPNISDKNRLRIMLPNVYRLFLNITVQMIKEQFHYDQSVSSMEFEHEIDAILTEVNAYIPRFVTRSDTPNRQERSLIFGASMNVVSGLFSAWNFYKDRRFKQKRHRTLRYIINEQKAFRTGILTNKGNLLSLTEITSANFKDIKEDFHNLQGSTSRKFICRHSFL